MESNNFYYLKENLYSQKTNQRSTSNTFKSYGALQKVKKILIILTVLVGFLNSVLQIWIMTRSYSNTKIIKITTSPPDPLIPDLPKRNGFWQPVSGVKYDFFVYSAYLETRAAYAVRVIAATRRRGSEPVQCRLWLSSGRVTTVTARTRILQDNGLSKYSAAYVMCVLRGTDISVSDVLNSTLSVIGSYALNGKVTNLLVVRRINQPETSLKNLHVCVKPFHSNYNQTEWLLEWLLLNTMLGVTHFYMYNQSMSKRTSCLLKNFRMNEFTILPWQLPLNPNLIRSEVAAYHDCLYRSIPKTSWLMILDIDEVLFPNIRIQLPHLIETLALGFREKQPASFNFQNAFFYTKWKDDSKSPAPVLTSRKTHRLKEVYPHNNLSRYIVKPGTVLELADHFVLEHRLQKKTKNISHKIALVHHYRNACDKLDYEEAVNEADECLKLPNLVDRTAHKWATDLWYVWRAEKDRIEKICGKLSG